MKKYVLIAIFAVSTKGYTGEVSEAGVHQRLVKLAGPNALDCGRASDKVHYAAKSACAVDAFNRKVPFLVQFNVAGTDAEVEEGLAFDVHRVLSSVETISWSPLYGGKPSGAFETHTCHPDSLRKLSDSVLTCDFA